MQSAMVTVLGHNTIGVNRSRRPLNKTCIIIPRNLSACSLFSQSIFFKINANQVAMSLMLYVK